MYVLGFVLVGGQGVAGHHLVNLLLDAPLHFGVFDHVEDDPAQHVGRGVEPGIKQVENHTYQVQFCQTRRKIISKFSHRG